jgi:uncharacterized protein YjbI with pentapeptide repeats
MTDINNQIPDVQSLKAGGRNMQDKDNNHEEKIPQTPEEWRGKLLYGVNAWNAFRKAHPDIIPNLAGVDLSGANLEEVNLSGANLEEAYLNRANLKRAKFSDANMKGVFLTEADLEGANLSGSNLKESYLVKANFDKASFWDANLVKAKLQYAKLEEATLWKANLREANLMEAKLKGASLMEANLEKANLGWTNLVGADLKSANLEKAKITGVQYNEREKKRLYKGIRISSAYGNALFKRFAQDQDYIETFREKHKYLYWLWYILTDCGRSILRCGLWALLIALCFGLFFQAFPDNFEFNTERRQASGGTWWTYFYYSIVTFTTLGFGDVTPKTLTGEILVTFEVIFGYLALGLLISILADKVARRS